MLACLENILSNIVFTLEGFEIFLNALISAGLFFVGWQANKIAKAQHEHQLYKTLMDGRDLYKSTYDKLTEGIALIVKNGKVCDHAISLIWQARDDARLYLPEEIEHYIEELRKLTIKTLELKNEMDELGSGTEYDKISSQYTGLLISFTRQQSSEIFSKYMKVKNNA